MRIHKSRLQYLNTAHCSLATDAAVSSRARVFFAVPSPEDNHYDAASNQTPCGFLGLQIFGLRRLALGRSRTSNRGAFSERRL